MSAHIGPGSFQLCYRGLPCGPSKRAERELGGFDHCSLFKDARQGSLQAGRFSSLEWNPHAFVVRLESWDLPTPRIRREAKFH